MQDAKPRRIWTAIFVVSLFYLSYRYPFQLNDAGTSPTYHFTPPALQIGKYAILLLLWLGAAAISLRTPVRKPMTGTVVFALTMFAYAIALQLLGSIAFSAQGYGLHIELFKIGFPFLFMALMANDTVARAEAPHFAIWIMRFCWLSTAFDAIQVLLFVTIHRLPALAYATGFTVRFGGLWDDPNSFPGVFAFAIPYVMLRWGFSLRTLGFLGIAAAALLGTQGLTGIAATLGSVTVAGILYALFAMRRSDRLMALVAASGLLVLACAVVLFGQSLFSDLFDHLLSGWLREKLPSIMARERSYSILDMATGATFAGLSPTWLFGENAWINIVANLGVPYAAAYLILGLLGARGLLRSGLREQTPEDRAKWFAMLSFVIWFLVSMFNIPQAEVFPLNMIFAIMIGIGISGSAPDAVRRRVSVASPIRAS